MTGFFLPLIFILNISGVVLLIFKERIEKMIPLAFILSALFLFPFGFIWKLSVGVYCLVGISLLFPIYLVMQKMVLKKDISSILDLYFTTGFCIFVALYVFIYFINMKRSLNSWDEISFWGPKVKEMLRLDTYYSVDAAAPHSHQDYPPAIQLIEFLWCKLAGGYQENTLYRSLQTFLLSLYLPMFCSLSIKKKNRLKGIAIIFLSVILIIICPLLFDTELHFYGIIYVDYSLAIITAYIIFSIVNAEEYSVLFFIRLATVLSFLILTKQMGLPLYLLCVGILLANIVIVKVPVLDKKIKGHRLSGIVEFALFVGIIPIIYRQIWSGYVKNLPQQFRISDIDIQSLPSIITMNGGQSYQHESFVNFIKKLFNYNMTNRTLTYANLVICLTVVTLFLCIKLQSEKQVIILDVFLSLGAIAYAFCMLLLYVYCFGEVEGPATASYPRYMATYLAAWVAIIIMLFISGLVKNGYFRIKYILLTLAFCFACIVPRGSIGDIKRGFQDIDVLADCRKAESVICTNTDDDISILYICQGDDGWNYAKLRYLCIPRTSSYLSLGDPEKYGENSIYTMDLSLEEAESRFQQFDYVYLHIIDEQFVERYGELFKRTELSNGQLFKVEDNGRLNYVAGIE